MTTLLLFGIIITLKINEIPYMLEFYHQIYNSAKNLEFKELENILLSSDQTDPDSITTFFTVISRLFKEKDTLFINHYIQSDINIIGYNTIILSECCRFSHLCSIDKLLNKDFDFSMHQGNIYYYSIKNDLFEITQKFINHKSFNIQSEILVFDNSLFYYAISSGDSKFDNVVISLLENYEYYKNNMDDYISSLLYSQNIPLIEKIRKDFNVEIDLSDDFDLLPHLTEIEDDNYLIFLEYLLNNTNLDPTVDNNDAIAQAFCKSHNKILALLKVQPSIKSSLKEDHPDIFSAIYLD